MAKKKGKRKPEPEKGKEAPRGSVSKDIEDIFAQRKISDKSSAEDADGGRATSLPTENGSIQKAHEALSTPSHAVKEDEFSDIRGTKKSTLLLQPSLITQENGLMTDSQFTTKMN